MRPGRYSQEGDKVPALGDAVPAGGTIEGNCDIMSRPCQDAGMLGMGSDIKGETKLGEQNMHAHAMCVYMCAHTHICVHACT